MGFPDRKRDGRARLAVELLEDRTTPAKLDDALSLALPELVSTGAVLGDRVNVVMANTTSSATDAAQLAASPFASSVNSLGFGIYSITLSPGTDLGTAVAYYGQTQGVLSAEPDAIVQVQLTPNDTRYSSLFGMTRIDAPTAWDTTTGDPNFVVGVIDSGIDHTHQDLYLNIWINQAEIPSAIRANLTDVNSDGFITFFDLNNAINIGAEKITDGNGNGRIDGGDILRTTATGGWMDGTDAGSNGRVDDLVGWDFANNDNNPFDDNNHGTHVAGTIGAMGNNSLGVVGVNWSVQMAGLKFLSASGSGAISGAVGALNYAVDAGMKVTNNSWGGGGFSSTMSTAIGRAQSAGHIFVAAAGNAASNNDTVANYPSNYNFDNVVAVASTTSTDALSSFSNYGATKVMLAAPGSSILSTTPNNTYSTFSGTSMAAPHVAGAIALYWSANPDLSYSEVIDVLKDSVDVLASLNGRVSTGGRLNVGNMFDVVSPPTVAPGPKVTAAIFSGTSTQLNNLQVTFDRAVDASTFTSADIASFTGPNGAITTAYNITPATGSSTTFNIGFAAQTVGGNYSMTFGPDIRDTLGNQMNQDGDTTAGEATADQFTATGSLVLTVNRTYTSSPNVSLPDLATRTVTMTLTDEISISDLNARVQLNHTYVSDLIIKLKGPDGTTVTLFNRRGGSANNLNTTTFDDEASTAISSGSAPFNGSYRPEQSLSAFDGKSTKGTWTLTVQDAARYDTGTLFSWSLVVNGTLGGGSGQAQAFGFLDEPAADFDSSSAMFAEPIFVSAEPARDSFVSSLSEDPAPASGRMLAWLPGESARRDYDAPPVASTRDDGDEFTNVPVESRRSESPFATLAALYFAPEDSSEGEGGDEFTAE